MSVDNVAALQVARNEADACADRVEAIGARVENGYDGVELALAVLTGARAIQSEIRALAVLLELLIGGHGE